MQAEILGRVPDWIMWYHSSVANAWSERRDIAMDDILDMEITYYFL
jgi:hypothetical protein